MIVLLDGDFFVNNQLKMLGAESKDNRTFFRLLISPRSLKDTSAENFEVSFYLSLLVKNLSDFKASIGVLWLNSGEKSERP